MNKAQKASQPRPQTNENKLMVEQPKHTRPWLQPLYSRRASVRFDRRGSQASSHVSTQESEEQNELERKRFSCTWEIIIYIMTLLN